MVTPIYFLNTLNDAALLLMRGADFLSLFEKPQRDAPGHGLPPRRDRHHAVAPD